LNTLFVDAAANPPNEKNPPPTTEKKYMWAKIFHFENP